MAKLEDIQKAIEQRRQQADPPPAPARPTGSRAYVAQVADGLKNSLIDQNKAYKAEREAGMVLLRIDPKQIARTEFANRHELSLSEQDAAFQQLMASIREHGQDTPVRVRPSPAGSALPYELVEGHRRHAACLALDAERDGGFLILARLDAAAIDTRDLVLKMYRENAEREDLSPYETGRMFQSWLDARVFPKQGALAKAVGLSDPAVTRYLQVAGLPIEVFQAFGDPRVIAYRWAQDLTAAIKARPDQVITAAVRIASNEPRPAPEAVLRELLAVTAPAGKRPSPSREEVVKIRGKVAFRIARKDGRLTIKYAAAVDAAAQRELTEKIKEVVESHLNQKLKGQP
jgi:ParB family chromosome partitioning protein